MLTCVSVQGSSAHFINLVLLIYTSSVLVMRCNFLEYHRGVAVTQLSSLVFLRFSSPVKSRANKYGEITYKYSKLCNPSGEGPHLRL